MKQLIYHRIIWKINSPGAPSHPRYNFVGSCDTWVPNFSQNPWYPTSCEGYEKYLWILACLWPFPTTIWSTLYISLHISWQDNIIPWCHLKKNSKWVCLKIVRVPSHPSIHSGFSSSPWHGGDFQEWKSNTFPIGKFMNQKISFNKFNHLSSLQKWECKNWLVP